MHCALCPKTKNQQSHLLWHTTAMATVAHENEKLRHSHFAVWFFSCFLNIIFTFRFLVRLYFIIMIVYVFSIFCCVPVVFFVILQRKIYLCFSNNVLLYRFLRFAVIEVSTFFSREKSSFSSVSYYYYFRYTIPVIWIASLLVWTIIFVNAPEKSGKAIAKQIKICTGCPRGSMPEAY